MLAYTGIETVSNMAEEARDPGHDVPRAVNLILVAVLGVYAGMTVVALSALPVVGHGAHAFTRSGQPPPRGYQNDPVLGIIQHLGLAGTLRQLLRYYVGMLAATILFIATNAGLIGISRLSWSLAEHRQLPSDLLAPAPTHRTPWFTIVVFSVVRRDPADPGQDRLPRQPLLVRRDAVVHDRARGGRRAADQGSRTASGPTGCGVNIRFRGAAIPLSAVIGGLGTFAAWVSVLVLHVDARYVGTGWMVLGLIGYVIYRRSQGFDLRSHYKIERRERPAFFVELEYHSAIVPIFGTDVDASALRAAAKLVGEGAIVEAIYMLRVPNQLSLDAGLEEEEQLGLSVLESAKVTGRRPG